MSIVDERVGYVKTFFDCLDFDVGAIMYQFPNRHASGMRETDELLAGVTWRNPYVTPSFYVWWDFDTNGHNDDNALFFDFDFSHAFKITDELSLNLGSGFGVANGSYMDHYTRGDGIRLRRGERVLHGPLHARRRGRRGVQLLPQRPRPLVQGLQEL